MTRLALLLLAGALPLTTGCIAAVVPLAAGAALAKTQGGRDAPLSGASSVAAASARSDLKVVRTSLTALPAPSALPSETSSVAPADPSIAAFRSYALAQAEAPAGAGKRLSAILPAASDLEVARTACGALPAAVFVDLDPGRGSFDPLAPGTANPAFGEALAALRARDVRVVWFSRLGANFAAAARTALAQGGLDPAGQDEQMLMRDIGERKQSLRDAAAKSVCPVAIIGDERADFDELYLYLKDPDAAVGLEAMIGKGWFLASPFTPPAEAGAGATP